MRSCKTVPTHNLLLSGGLCQRYYMMVVTVKLPLTFQWLLGKCPRNISHLWQVKNCHVSIKEIHKLENLLEKKRKGIIGPKSRSFTKLNLALGGIGLGRETQLLPLWRIFSIAWLNNYVLNFRKYFVSIANLVQKSTT